MSQTELSVYRRVDTLRQALLRAMLDSHRLMAIPDKSHFVVNVGVTSVTKRAKSFDKEGLLQDRLQDYGFVRLGSFADSVIESLMSSPRETLEMPSGACINYAAERGKSLYGDKTPAFVMNMCLIATLFLESRSSHIIRDGRDVALSYLDAELGPKSTAGNALYWLRRVRHGRKERGREVGSFG